MAIPSSQRKSIASLAPPRPVVVDAPALIRSDRLILRALLPSDEAAYIAAVRESRAELNAFMPLHKEGETDEQMFDRQLRIVTAEQAAGQCLRCVGITDDGRIAGGFNLNAISRGLEWQADITWWIATPLTRRGLATEGVRALADHALADMPGGLGLHQVHAWITRDNARSIRLAERAGFVKQAEQESFLNTGANWAVHDKYTRRV